MNPHLPDLVISLTGVNDVAYSASSILLRDKYKHSYPLLAEMESTIIHPLYIVNDLNIKSNHNFSNLLRQGLLNSSFLYKFMPSLQAFINNSEQVDPLPIFQYLGLKNNRNIFRICNSYISIATGLKSLTHDQILSDTGEFNKIRYATYDDAIKGINPISAEENFLLLKECIKNRKDFVIDIPNADLTTEHKSLIINNLISNHFQTHSILKALNINYFAFLQPISSFNKNAIKDIPGYDYNLLHWYMRGDIIGHKVNFPGFEIFESIKKELQKKPYNDFFFNLDSIDIQSYEKDPFTLDNIHYKEWFSKDISNEIYERIFTLKNIDTSNVKNFISPLPKRIDEYCGFDISFYRDNINFSSKTASVEDLSSIFDDNINTFWEARQELPFCYQFRK